MSATDRPYDLIIRNGMVIDGSGLPRRRADIGIRDGRVARMMLADRRLRHPADRAQLALDQDAAFGRAQPGAFEIALAKRRLDPGQCLGRDHADGHGHVELQRLAGEA
jgi:hypothetical protein